MSTNRPRFAVLHRSRRVWAIASIHGDAARLRTLHAALEGRFEPGDRVVYLGNIIGRGTAIRETLDELLAFRGRFLAAPRAFACDIAYLRGSQEEMWQKVLQLQFASDPRSVMAWMLEQGVGTTLAAYGSGEEEARRIANSGPVDLTRWTSGLRRRMQQIPGHFEMLGALKRAAYTDDGSLLFVNAGLDPARPLEAQEDSFWWGIGGFERIEAPYERYRRVVRGFAAAAPGVKLGDYTATVDAGCGRDGPLLAACFRPDGNLVDQVEA